MSTKLSFFIGLTPRNIVCGILLLISMLLFAVAFVLLGRAEQHIEPGYQHYFRLPPAPEHFTDIGRRLLERGKRVRGLALLIFGVFAILAIVWR